MVSSYPIKQLVFRLTTRNDLDVAANPLGKLLCFLADPLGKTTENAHLSASKQAWVGVSAGSVEIIDGVGNGVGFGSLVKLNDTLIP